MGANELTGAAVSAYLFAELIEWAKRSKWFPWLNECTETANRIAAIAIAGASAIGVHLIFSPEAGTLTITGLTWHGIATTSGDWLKQWAIQNFFYRSAIQPNQAAMARAKTTEEATQ